MNTEWIKNKKGQRIFAVSHAKAVVRGDSTVDTDLKKIENHYTADGTTLGRNMEYAIIYEWADSNLENENRIGYFVALDAEDPTKIVKATKNSTIIGIVSYAPAFAGNAHAEMYDEDKKLLSKYAYVSIIGQIPVRHDETVAEVGMSVMPNENGIASASEYGYIVTQIVDENFALVLVELNSQALVEMNKALGKYVERVGDIVLTDAPIYNTSDESYNKISGGSKGNNSASLTLYGKDNGANGSFILEAGNDTSQSLLVGQSSGRLQWAGKDVVRSINGNKADESGEVSLDFGGVKTVNNKAPDENGNVTISADRMPDYSSKVSLALNTMHTATCDCLVTLQSNFSSSSASAELAVYDDKDNLLLSRINKNAQMLSVNLLIPKGFKFKGSVGEWSESHDFCYFPLV